MKRLILLTTSLALIAVPGTAAAASSHGVILSASPAQRRLQLVDGKHVVHQYRYRGSRPFVGLGSRVRFVRRGSTISGLKAGRARAHRVSFLGTVVRSSSVGLQLKLGDGQRLDVATREVLALAQARRRAPVAVAAASHSKLQPGVVVMVTETLGRAGTSVSIKPASASSPGVSGERHTAGVLIGLGSSTVTLKAANGTMTLRVPSQTLSNADLQPCSKVTVAYHQDGWTLNADKLKTVGGSSSSNCNFTGAGANGSSSAGSGDGDSGDGDTPDVVGNITTISASGLTISVPGQGSMSFIVDDPDITDGFLVGDNVDVIYSQDPGGALDASDVEYNEDDALGTVLAVSDGSITIADSSTGAHETYTADPSEEMFSGINVGDEVDVSYHMLNGQVVVDEVDENGN